MTTKAPIVIEGTFADIKSVRTRSVVQMVIEVPIEHAAEIVSAFGFPQPGEEIHVVVARLAAPANRAAVTLAPDAETPRIEKSTSLPQMAGILCGEPAFDRFLREKYRHWADGPLPTDTADLLRKVLGVSSRRDLVDGTPAGRLFRGIRVEYQNWLRAPA